MVESGGKRNATIKSHHNVGGLPERMDLELVEPLRLLFKDEVRRVGTELGLPEDVVQRQPFPGPGLAVRIVGEVTAERLETLRAADRIVLEEIRRAGSTASCGSGSRCCRRSGPSGSWATAAPTPTRSCSGPSPARTP